MSIEKQFTKDNLDEYLKEVAKEYKRSHRKSPPIEIILIGGAAILVNYGFREMTYDIDAVISAGTSMKEAINTVGDRHGLPNGWLNSDFTRTRSYSDKLYEISSYYRTFSNMVVIRTVSAEYLIAMKLMSGRRYKNNLSDIAVYYGSMRGMEIPSRSKLLIKLCPCYTETGIKCLHIQYSCLTKFSQIPITKHCT